MAQALNFGRSFKQCLQHSRAMAWRNYSQKANNCLAGEAILSQFQPGKEVSGFRVEKLQEIPELQLTAVRLQHIKTKAQYLHIARDDTNNVFCIGFKTVPMDDTGVPHILEHNVLCGSKQYPCRDPFFKMLNRSLSTFMNAMTGSDCTFYPFSTQHPVDFKNLLSVYLDASLFPNLKELDFMQEGWRLEPENLQDKTSPLMFKGVVFNEMKGVFADPQQIFARQLQNNLLPSHTYGYESGGDPLHIPELSWQQMRTFHSQYYHPSNAFLFTYGNLPLETHLSYIDSNYLNKFEQLDVGSEIPMEKPWSTPRTKHITCCVDPLAPPAKQSNLAVSYMLTSVHDQWDNFVLGLVAELLVSGPSAPFYKSLLEAELGTSFSPSTGFSEHSLNSAFTIGLQGIDMESKDKIVAAIEETFRTAVKDGFSDERIESVLHRIELALKHQTSNFGLSVVMSLVHVLNLGADPIEALSVSAKIDKLRDLIKQNPKYLQEQIEKYFLNNTHKLTLSMSPDASYESQRKKIEDQLLESKVSALTATDRERIIELCSQLKIEQETEVDSSCLPTLNASDISRSTPRTDLTRLTLAKNMWFASIEQPTNGVSYFNAVLSTQHLPQRLQPLVPLFCEIMTQMGAGNLDFRRFEQAADLVCGGLSAHVHVANDPSDLGKYEQGIHLNSHSLTKNFSAMMDLWGRIFTALRFDDHTRFATLVKMLASEHANTLVHSGHTYAMSSAGSSVNYSGHLAENWQGLTYLKSLKQQSEMQDYSQLLADLQLMASLVFKRDNVRMALTTSPKDTEQNARQLDSFISCIDGSSLGGVDNMVAVPTEFTPQSRALHHVFEFPVNFASKAYPCVPFVHEDNGPLKILARIMFKFLHREIREKGGAYGGGAMCAGGSFQFYSYRDPNSMRTLQTFDDSVDWILNGNVCEQDLAEAKLGVFQKVDSPVSAGSKGMLQFSQHITHDMFTAYRCSILDASLDKVKHVAHKYIKSAKIQGTTLIGPKNDATSNDTKWTTHIH